MIKVGITGGIGSGKTYVCKMFESLGVPVYNADERAKYLMNNDENLKSNIIKLFGSEAYLNGELNRQFIAQIVFADKEKLEQLNALVHPAVAKDSEEWNQQHTDKPYTLKEAALLFESGSYKTLDKTILVHADENQRILRVMQRDNLNKESVEARIKNQLNDAEKMPLADFIINNDGNREIDKIVKRIHEYFNFSYNLA